MDKLLSNDHFEISNGDKIININSLANKKIERGEKVINATPFFDFNTTNLSTKK